MVSASKAKREAERAAKKAAGGDDGKKKTPTSRISSKAGSKAGSNTSSVAGDATPPVLEDDQELENGGTSQANLPDVAKLALQEDEHGMSDRVTTGVLASLASSRDVKLNSVSLVFHGRVLVNDTTLE